MRYGGEVGLGLTVLSLLLLVLIFLKVYGIV